MGHQSDRRKETGTRGETLAAAFVAREGMVLLARNWRCRTGEIDLVAMDGDHVVFLEVRTRKSVSRFGSPAESVDPRKQRQVRQTAQVYLLQHPVKPHVQPRFDVISITLAPDNTLQQLNHIKNAF